MPGLEPGIWSQSGRDRRVKPGDDGLYTGDIRGAI